MSFAAFSIMTTLYLGNGLSYSKTDTNLGLGGTCLVYIRYFKLLSFQC